MKAESLKKGMFFNPDPYVKMSVHPGKKRKSRRFQSRHMIGEQHQRTSVRGNTCMPVWTREVGTSGAVPRNVKRRMKDLLPACDAFVALVAFAKHCNQKKKFKM